MSSTCDLERLINAVVTHGQDQWIQFGRLLGFNNAQITANVENIPKAAGKLFHIIDMKKTAVGERQLRLVLLDACGKLQSPILAAVKDELNSQDGVTATVQTVTDGLSPAMTTNGDTLKKYKEFADTVRRCSNLGGPWDEWSDIPVDVLDFVCKVTADYPDRLADLLGVCMGERLGKPKADRPALSARDIVLIWIRRDGEDARLEILFEKIDKMGVFGQLKGKIKKHMADLPTR